MTRRILGSLLCSSRPWAALCLRRSSQKKLRSGSGGWSRFSLNSISQRVAEIFQFPSRAEVWSVVLCSGDRVSVHWLSEAVSPNCHGSMVGLWHLKRKAPFIFDTCLKGTGSVWLTAVQPWRIGEAWEYEQHVCSRPARWERCSKTPIYLSYFLTQTFKNPSQRLSTDLL